MKRWPFQVINEENAPKYEVSFRNKKLVLTPEQISATVLTQMKNIAENYLNDIVTHAVITIPANFNDAQRQATRDAAEIAGLEVLQLINEPTAAAVAFGLKEKVTSEQNILIFDMGGGTFDVSILNINADLYDVKAVGGDTHLGGEDFNNRMLDYFMDEIKQKHKLDLSKDHNAMNELLKQCEIAKIALSTSQVAQIQVDAIINGADFKSSITRARFEELNKSFFNNAIEILEKTIKAAKINKSDIHEVVLVGGSTYIPKVQSMLRECLNGKALNKSIKPDEAVAYGAAVYASILHGVDANDLDLVLLDVTPHSLGVAVVEDGQEDVMSTIINCNTPIPIKLTRGYTTIHDNQTTIKFRVYEGEHKDVKKNNLLGYYLVTGIPREPAGKPDVQTTMEINADGILKVNSINKSNNAHGSIVIQEYKNRLSHSDIDRFKKQEKDYAIVPF